MLAINIFVLRACLNLPQGHNLAWQPCNDSWAAAVFKMAVFSNVPILAMWIFVRNRMLPQIKQRQLEPHCNWYYWVFFIFLFYFRITISVISNDSETNNLSFTSQHFRSLFLAIYLTYLLYFHWFRTRSLSSDLTVNPLERLAF